jgi:uncharacterized iron-regulated membrane protein
MISVIETAHSRAALYRNIWRWHFYAGLFVMPFILILSVTGLIYLFKPQIDGWEESSFRGLPTINSVSPNQQLETAMATFPGAQFESYRLPEDTGDAAMITLVLDDGGIKRQVFVSPQGKMLGSLEPDSRISNIVSEIHGSFLAGKLGSWLVELAGSWAIVMVLSGLYLWWPSGRSLSGVVWPRLSFGKRAFWRDLHAVTGFWVSGLALVLLITALPWAGVWGEAFKLVRTQMAWTKDRPDWKIGVGNEHADHDHAAMMRQQASGIPMAGLADIVAKAKAERGLPFPVMVKPPSAAERFGPPSMAWTVKSETQDRPRRVTITYDMATGKELSRKGQADKHPIDKAIAYGIAWHEGQLFGWINQLIGLLTAIALITLMVSGFVMWRRRKPEDVFGAPPLPAVPAKIRGVVAIIFLLAAMLPLLAISLIVLWAFDRLLLPHLPRLSIWLGVAKVQAS